MTNKPTDQDGVALRAEIDEVVSTYSSLRYAFLRFRETSPTAYKLFHDQLLDLFHQHHNQTLKDLLDKVKSMGYKVALDGTEESLKKLYRAEGYSKAISDISELIKKLTK